MHYSDLIKLRFGKAADTYDSSASTHVEIARHLVDLLRNRPLSGIFVVDPVLESSCTSEYTAVLRSVSPKKSSNIVGSPTGLVSILQRDANVTLDPITPVESAATLQAHHAYPSTCSKALTQVLQALDVGAGTGILSEELLKAFPDVSLTLMDISSEMLARAEEKYHGRMSYINANAEDFPIRGFDILISSMAMQWFRDIEAFIAENLKYARTIAFALPILGTFDEWYDLLEARGIEPHRMPYKSFDQMMSLCNLANYFIAEEKTYPLTFKSALDFVRYLKLIGASACRTGAYSYEESASILRALHAYPAVGAENVTLATSYRVFFGILSSKRE